jgi:hypothetical protein
VIVSETAEKVAARSRGVILYSKKLIGKNRRVVKNELLIVSISWYYLGVNLAVWPLKYIMYRRLINIEYTLPKT